LATPQERRYRAGARRRAMSKVLVLCPYVPHPPSHGGSIRTRTLLQALAHDHAVELAAAAHGDADLANLHALAHDFGIAVHPLPARAGGGGAARKLAHWLRGESELLRRRWPPAALARVRELAAAGRHELLVADSSFTLPLAAVAGAPRSLLSLHNLEHALLGRADAVARPWSDRLTRRVEARRVRAAEAKAIARATRTVVCSDVDAALARGLAPTAGARIAVVPNAVDLDRLPLQPPPVGGPPRLLFVGGLDYPPNLEAATELVERHVPALRAAFPGLVVRLVGRDPGGASARWRGVPGVELLGPVADLLPLYRDSHAAYLPIRSGGGTRLKILEAWALGLPVLSTAVGCEGLDAVDGEVLRRFETVEQGVAALRSVLDGQGPELARRARTFVAARHAHAIADARWRELAVAALSG
jgi:glycosyltransferase involved in cell wall biosynthesis